MGDPDDLGDLDDGVRPMNLHEDVSFTPLTPLAFLGRSAAVLPGATAVA